MSATEVRELVSEAEWLDAFPVVRQLRDHLDDNRLRGPIADVAVRGFLVGSGGAVGRFRLNWPKRGRDLHFVPTRWNDLEFARDLPRTEFVDQFVFGAPSSRDTETESR